MMSVSALRLTLKRVIDKTLINPLKNRFSAPDFYLDLIIKLLK